jgi:hypothetical protein
MGAWPDAGVWGRLSVPGVEPAETMPTVSLRRARRSTRPRLDTALLRRSVDDSVAARHRCAHCRRTPLTGEVIHVYQAPGGEERLVCELCRPLRREPPAGSRLMHSPAHERTVRGVCAQPTPRPHDDAWSR